MRGRSLVAATGIALLALTSGGLTAASAAPSTPDAAGQPATPLIQGLVVIATGSVAPLYQTGTVGAPVALASGSGLIDAAFTPNGQTAYVANAGADSVTPVNVDDDITLVPGPPITTGPDPVAVAVTPNGKTALVVDNHGKKIGSHYQYWVQWISTTTNTIVAHVKVGISPIDIAITPNGRRAYVSNVNSGTVTPIAVGPRKALRAIHVGFDPEALAITPNGKYVYVANNLSRSVTPIRISDDKALTPIKVGKFPAAIAITASGKYAYVTNNGSGTVSKIKLSTRKVVKTIKTGGYPDNVVITPNGKAAYVGSFDDQATRKHLRTVIALDLTTGTVARHITVGRGPIALGVKPGGLTVYVANFYSNTVTAITVATNTAGAGMGIGGWFEPSFIAMRP